VAATPIHLVTAASIDVTQVKGVDSASKLAADVNAAAGALENLKRLLQRQLPDSIQARLERTPGSYAEIPSISSKLPWQPPQMNSEHTLPQLPVAPPVPANLVHASEPRHIEIRDFLAGFALSSAIGALLYIFLTAS
jgi:hypothetical protein